MAEDTLRLTVDPGNSFDVLNRVSGAADRLGRSGARIGEGFIRGDRAVRIATQNITSGLLSATNAADAAGIAFQSLERVFRVPLAVTIGGAAGIAAFVLLNKEIEKTRLITSALGKELQKSFANQAQLSVTDLTADIDALNKTLEAVEKRASGPVQKLLGQLFQRDASGNRFDPKIPTAQRGPTEIQDQINKGQERLNKLLDAQADKELFNAKLKLEDNELTKAELILEEKRAKLLEDSVTKGGNTLSIFKRFLAAQIDLEVAARKKAESDKKTLDAAKATTAELEKQAAALSKQQTAGEAASERRRERSRKSEEKSLKDQLSREGDPEKREDIKDRLAEIQQEREDEAKKKQEQEMARQAAERAAEQARQEQQRIQAQQQEEARAAAQKKSDQSEVQRFGRVLSPEERLNQRLQDEGDAREKKFQDDEQARQQGFKDKQEASDRGISEEQLKNERDFNKSRGKDVSSVDDLANKDFSGIASLANQDFSGIASLGGLSIQIV